MDAIHRLAAFKAAVVLHGTSAQEAAANLGVSYNHLRLVLLGERRGSRRLETGLAEFLDVSVNTLFVRQTTSGNEP